MVAVGLIGAGSINEVSPAPSNEMGVQPPAGTPANAETPKTAAYYQTSKLATRKPVGCNASLGGVTIRPN